jgi:hypothetical protein
VSEDVKVEVSPKLTAYAATLGDLAKTCGLDSQENPKAHLSSLKRAAELRRYLVNEIEYFKVPDWLRQIACDAETLAQLHVDFHLVRHPELGRPSSDMADFLEKYVIPMLKKKIVEGIEEIDLDL